MLCEILFHKISILWRAKWALLAINEKYWIACLQYLVNKQKIAGVSQCCNGRINDVISSGKMSSENTRVPDCFLVFFPLKWRYSCFYYSTETRKLCTLLQNENDVNRVSVLREIEARPIRVCIGRVLFYKEKYWNIRNIARLSLALLSHSMSTLLIRITFHNRVLCEVLKVQPISFVISFPLFTF